LASKIFAAAYPGECAECFDPIEPGDDVQYVDDELVHADCNPELDDDDLGWEL
jgi:hypothetical protein